MGEEKEAGTGRVRQGRDQVIEAGPGGVEKTQEVSLSMPKRAREAGGAL